MNSGYLYIQKKGYWVTLKYDRIMTKEDRELIEEKFKGIKAEIKANHDMQMLKLESIYDQALKTNGRVTDIEKETRIVRLFEKKPILIFLVGIGLIVLLNILDFERVIKLLF